MHFALWEAQESFQGQEQSVIAQGDMFGCEPDKGLWLILIINLTVPRSAWG